VGAFERISALEHPNILPVEQFALADAHIAWLLTPYTGNQEGLVTLQSLLAAKGGRMSPDEAERAIVQVLRAVEYAHSAGHIHGPIGADQVMVDRHGRVSVELYGLERRLSGLGAGNSEVVRDEVRSVVELGYRLVTGLTSEEPRISAGRLVDRLGGLWDAWFDTGLDALGGGFSSASEAAAALPSARRDSEPPVPVVGVRRVLGRMRAVLRQGP
jgi:serine/threonine protein kinase